MAATVVISQQQQVGSIPSASRPVPLNADGTIATNPATGQPYRFILVHGTASDVDALDAAKSCILYIRVSYDGVTYVSHQSTPWTGGVRDKNGNPQGPDFNVDIPRNDLTGLPPQRVMVTLDTVGLNSGLTIDFR